MIFIHVQFIQHDVLEGETGESRLELSRGSKADVEEVVTLIWQFSSALIDPYEVSYCRHEAILLYSVGLDTVSFELQLKALKQNVTFWCRIYIPTLFLEMG